MNALTPAEKAELLRRRMALLRRRMERDVLEMKESGKQITEILSWQSIYRQFPWPILGATALAGFLIAPGHRIVPEVKLHAKSVEEIVSGAASSQASSQQEKNTQSSLLSGLIAAGGAMLTRSLVSAATTYGQRYAAQWLTEVLGHHRRAPESEEVLT
jgi:hypothetical protein